MIFLSAHWKHLVLVNYVVDPDVLKPLVPAKTRIDSVDNKVFVSLVAFMFEKTNVLRVPAVFHRSFEEVNLRFYVVPEEDDSKRAVTFIKEIVPGSLIPWVANNLFNENYVKMRMAHQVSPDHCTYSWGEGLEHQLSVTPGSEMEYPEPGSIAEFITEHYWGYAAGKGSTLEYEVTHPQWKCCEVDQFEISVDFGKLYGNEFALLNSQQPFNVLYCQGSPVTVSFPRKL